MALALQIWPRHLSLTFWTKPSKDHQYFSWQRSSDQVYIFLSGTVDTLNLKIVMATM